jgi:CheY-like chemotaxis protein
MIREHEGSGLGLAIARGLVKLLGGTLNAVSEKGIGSTFSFTVPYKTPAISTKAPSSNIGEPGNKDEQMVLIAEDEESNYLFMQAALEIMGYHYIHVTNGADAVDVCKQKESISLVLMDIKMPVMNGIEATELIHASRPDLPIVAITAYAQTGDEQRFMDAGFNGYLAKPVIKEDLQTLLQKYLHPAGG